MFIDTVCLNEPLADPSFLLLFSSSPPSPFPPASSSAAQPSACLTHTHANFFSPKWHHTYSQRCLKGRDHTPLRLKGRGHTFTGTHLSFPSCSFCMRLRYCRSSKAWANSSSSVILATTFPEVNDEHSVKKHSDDRQYIINWFILSWLRCVTHLCSYLQIWASHFYRLHSHGLHWPPSQSAACYLQGHDLWPLELAC